MSMLTQSVSAIRSANAVHTALLLVRIASAGLLVIMLGAIFLVHISHGFDVSKNGFEYAMTQALLTIAIIIAGPGAYHAMSLVRPDPPAPSLQ